MINTIVWLLIATSGNGSPVVLGTYAKHEKCQIVAADMEKQSRERNGMNRIYAICVRDGV